MGTQRRREPPQQPAPNLGKAPAPKDGQDLGIPEDGGPIADDPSGFVPEGAPRELHGRRVRPVSPADLEKAHRMHAGDTPMFGDPSVEGGAPKTEDLRTQQAPAQDPSARNKAEQMMSGMFNAQAPTTNRMQQTAPPPVQENPSPFAAHPGDSPEAREYRMTQSSAALEYLLQQEHGARDKGDYAAAEQARRMIDSLTNGVKVERTPKTKGRHPALKKLMANLGLERIKPESIEWAGTTWMFAPNTMRMDRWIADNLEDDGFNIAPLMISAGLVGLDGVPIYEALGIPMDAEYKVSEADVEEGGNPEKTVTINVALYRKFCECGSEIQVESKLCEHCGTKHDPFDIPSDLRIKCADVFYEMLEEKFGAYEELATLLELKNRTMKDRRMDKEELYPLARPSQEQKETPTSQSGDE